MRRIVWVITHLPSLSAILCRGNRRTSSLTIELTWDRLCVHWPWRNGSCTSMIAAVGCFGRCTRSYKPHCTTHMHTFSKPAHVKMSHGERKLVPWPPIFSYIFIAFVLVSIYLYFVMCYFSGKRNGPCVWLLNELRIYELVHGECVWLLADGLSWPRCLIELWFHRYKCELDHNCSDVENDQCSNIQLFTAVYVFRVGVWSLNPQYEAEAAPSKVTI